MRKVISNTTPLIALSEIGKIHILRDLYGEIMIPQGVLDELKTEPGYSEIRNNTDWVHVKDISDYSQKKMFTARLHKGEVETILLALEEEADLIILDDLLARKTAKYLDIPLTGTIGTIVKAKKAGYISNASHIIDQLIANGLYITDKVKQIALIEAGEADI